MNNRVAVIKIGTSLLTKEDGTIQLSFLANICEEIADVQKSGWQIVLVSSGAMASGKGVLNKNAQSLEERPLLSTVGQPIMMGYYADFFRIQGINISQCLLTWRNFEVESEKKMLKYNLQKILENNIIPIVNENDLIADEELSGDNDTLAAKISVLLEAKKLIIFSDVDGIYKENPQINPHAEKISEVFNIDEEIKEILLYIGEKKSENSLGGMKSKIESARLAVNGGVETTILKGVLGGGNTKKILIENKKVGTTFYAKK